MPWWRGASLHGNGDPKTLIYTFLSFFPRFILFLIMCMSICLCVGICTWVHVPVELEYKELWACWHGWWELNSGPPINNPPQNKRQQLLLTIEPSFQLPDVLYGAVCNYKIESSLSAYGWGLLDKEHCSYIEQCCADVKRKEVLSVRIREHPGFTSMEYLLSVREGSRNIFVFACICILKAWKWSRETLTERFINLDSE